ncbi:MAG: Hint domain-containing protein [Paracoccaceae bacterium]
MFMQDITRFASAPVTPASAATSQGIFGATLVETASGWRTADSLRIGDHLYTLDGGLQRIAAISRRIVSPGEAMVLVPGGYFDACSEVMLLPAQGLLLDTIGLMGAPYARVPASALATCLGVRHRNAPTRAEIVTPIFAEEEAIWAQSGMLLVCPGIKGDSAYPSLHDKAATLFVAERSRRFA